VTPPFASGDWVRVVGESALDSGRDFIGRVGRIYDEPMADREGWYIRVEFEPGAWDGASDGEWDGYHDLALVVDEPGPEELARWILSELSK
jgi:hypothetical protein